MSAKDNVLRKLGMLFGGIEYEPVGVGVVGYLEADGSFNASPSVGLTGGYIWVLLEGQRSSVRAVPAGVRSIVNLPVDVRRHRRSRELHAFLDVQRAIATFGLPAALALAQPNTVGDLSDETVRQRRLKIGRLYSPTGDLTFRVSGFWYRDSAGALKWWNDKIQDAAHKLDVSAEVPGSADLHCLVIVSLDPDASAPELTATVGSDVSTSTTFAEDDIETLAATVTAGHYPLYALELVNGNTAVPEAQIWAIQELINDPAPAPSSSLPAFGAGVVKTLASYVASAGSDRHLILAAQSGTADNLIEITGLAVGDEVILRADAGDTITVKHNDAGATDKIILYNAADMALSGDQTLKLVKTAAGKVVQVVDEKGSSSGFTGYIWLREEQTANTQSGTFTFGAWRTRVLNTEKADTGGHCSLASNQFTLAAGTYCIRWRAPAFSVNRHRSRLYDITNTATVIAGGSGYASLGGTAQHDSSGVGRFTIAGSTVFEIQHYGATTSANQGFGVEANDGEIEVYTEVELWRE